jgi:DNA transposition AAA+ family ATPase
MDVKKRINKMLDEGTITLGDLKKATGYERSTISQVLSGKYQASEDNIVNGLENFLNEWDYRWNLCNTTGFKAVQKVLELTSKCRELAVITGNSGVGKTEAVRYYSMLNEHAAYVVMNKAITAKELLDQILFALGEATPGGSLNERLTAIKRSLQRRFRMIIVDEADLLQVRHLEILRAIFDNGSCAMVLIGLPRLLMLLTRGQTLKENLAQLYSRVGFRRDITPPRREDVEMICERHGFKFSRQFINDMMGWIHNSGELRTMDKLLERSKLFAEMGETDEERIRAAYGLLVQ